MPMSDYLRRLRRAVGHDTLALPSAAVVVHDDSGRVLFGRHADRNIWVVPGGLIEPGELPADAAIRETWEETGLIVEVTGLLGVFGGPDFVVHYHNGDIASYVGAIFYARPVGGELRADGDEILELRYLLKSELNSVSHPRWISELSDALFDKTAQPGFQKPTWSPPADDSAR